MKVYYLSLKSETPNNDYWDYGFINDMFKDLQFETEEVSKLPKTDKAIVVLPARHHKGLEQEVQHELDKIQHKVFFAMGDEEADFDIDKIKASHIWVQNPHPDKHDKYNKLGTGYPPQSQEILPTIGYEKNLNVYFSGQITHKRRVELIENMREYELGDSNTLVNRTKGFTQGVSHQDYYRDMARSKIAPAPSGAVIPDSFRLFEALECMSIPLADEVNPTGTITEYWDWLFGETVPFPKYTSSDRLVGLIHETLDKWDLKIQKQTCWWIKFKRDFKLKLQEQLNE